MGGHVREQSLLRGHNSPIDPGGQEQTEAQFHETTAATVKTTGTTHTSTTKTVARRRFFSKSLHQIV